MPRRLALLGALCAVLSIAPAALPACVLELDEGLSASIVARFDAATGASADGAAVRLDEARLHVHHATLVACPGAEARWSLAPARAFAHHPSTDPLSAAHPSVIELGGPPVSLGGMRPPPGRYCALRVAITPATEMDEHALIARGGWERGGVAGPLELLAPGQRELELPLDPPLALDAARTMATLELEVDLPAALAAQEVVDRDPVELGLDVMVDLGAALRARVLP